MKIQLHGGREITLSRLVQWRTNDGVLCGAPDAGLNDERLRNALDEARGIGPAEAEPLLLAPRRIAARNGQWLPAVTCVGVFDSTALERPDSEPYSSLTVVWLQDAFALPIEQRALDEIRRIDWDVLACDWCW